MFAGGLGKAHVMKGSVLMWYMRISDLEDLAAYINVRPCTNHALDLIAITTLSLLCQKENGADYVVIFKGP